MNMISIEDRLDKLFFLSALIPRSDQYNP